MTEAVIHGLDRWLDEVEQALAGVAEEDPGEALRRAWEAIEATRHRHAGLARNFLAALARAQHDQRVAEQLAGGFRKTRPAIARLLGFGGDQAGEDAAGLVHSQFVGLLFQGLLDPTLAIEGERMRLAQARLRGALPEEE